MAAFTKMVYLAMLHMIPLLLCALHIAKLLCKFTGGRKELGFPDDTQKCRRSGFDGQRPKTHSKNKLQQNEGGGKVPRPFGFCGGNGSGPETVDKGT